MSVYIPRLYLSLHDLAEERGIHPDKLELGLGLRNMAVPDTGEDAVTMAAEAVIDLVRKNALAPEEIGRLYVGTESMVDGSKPIASYVTGILAQYYISLGHTAQALRHCDAVDLTFACIGATDALQNALDWVRLHPGQQAIIVASDIAKYDMGTPGEYTQGAGAVAMLISARPRLIALNDTWGMSMECTHDFFKPLRRRVVADPVSPKGIGPVGKQVETVHKETPVYDGQYSNQCYQEHITGAYLHFCAQKTFAGAPLDRWERLVFHLPYAYHARRVFTEIYLDFMSKTGRSEALLERHQIADPAGQPELKRGFLKAVSKTPEYKAFVEQKIEKGERASSDVGNIYTGAIYLSLASTLESDLISGADLEGSIFGFFAYGSGAKSKVFEGVIQPGWKEIVSGFGLFEMLGKRKKISFPQYEHLHRGTLLQSLDSADRTVHLTHSGCTVQNRFARYYRFGEMADGRDACPSEALAQAGERWSEAEC